MHLQSSTIDLKKTLATELDNTRSTETRESISISRWVIWSSKANCIPSKRALNSAWTLVICPMVWEKPPNHDPQESWISPPPPAIPGFPKEEPSVLSLALPKVGGSHFTVIEEADFELALSPMRQKNSAANDRIFLIGSGNIGEVLKAKRFLHNQIVHKPKENTVCQAIWLLSWALEEEQLNEIQSKRGKVNVWEQEVGIERSF